MAQSPTARGGRGVEEIFDRRTAPGRLLAQDAPRIADACREMAVCFRVGGRLVVFGTGQAATDAQHVAVEFVHPVIVGKRALPALSLTGDVATVTGVAGAEGVSEIFAHQLARLARPHDIALGISVDGSDAAVLRGLETARELGMLTVALVGGDGGAIAVSRAVDHVVVAHSQDPQVVKEIHVTAYHLLWELVHVFLEQPDVVSPEAVR